MARYFIRNVYTLSLSGSGNKSTKYEVRDSSLEDAAPPVKTLSNKTKALELIDRLNRQAAAEVANPTKPKTPRKPRTPTAKEETEVNRLNRAAEDLGFEKYRIRRYRYYLHLVDEEKMPILEAKEKAATASRHVIWPYRLTREELSSKKR